MANLGAKRNGPSLAESGMAALERVGSKAAVPSEPRSPSFSRSRIRPDYAISGLGPVGCRPNTHESQEWGRSEGESVPIQSPEHLKGPDQYAAGRHRPRRNNMDLHPGLCWTGSRCRQDRGSSGGRYTRPRPCHLHPKRRGPVGRVQLPEAWEQQLSDEELLQLIRTSLEQDQ